MGVRDQRIGGLTVGVDQVGAQINDLQKGVADLQQAIKQSGFVQVDLPEVDSSFSPIFTRKKSGWAVTLRYFIPGYTTALIIHLVKRDEVVDADSYANTVKEKIKDITDTDREAQAVEARFESPPLDSDSVYDIVDLIAIDQNGERHINPEGGPDYSGYPGNVLYTFTTPASLANAPGKPTLARIVENTFQTTDDGLIPIITVREYADDAETLTFFQQGTTQVQCKFEDVDEPTVHPRRTVTIEDDSLTFIDVEVGDLFIIGRKYSHIHNLAWSGEDTAIALPASAVEFIAGGFGDPSDLTDFTYVSEDSEPTDDPNVINMIITLHQPDPAFRLKNATIKRKVTGRPDADYDLPKNLVIDRFDLRDPVYNVPGDITLSFPMSVNPAKNYTIQIFVRVVGGFDKTFTTGSIAGTGVFLPASSTANSVPPSLVTGGSLLASRDDYGNAGETQYPGLMWQTAANSGTKINNLGTGVGGATIDSKGLQWDDTNGRLVISTSVFTLGGKPAVRVGKIFQADDVISVCVLLQSDSADENQDITLSLIDQSGPTVMASCTLLAAETISTTEGNFLFLLQVDSGYTLTDKQWLQWEFSQNPSNTLYLRNVQCHYGQIFGRFNPNAEEQAAIDGSSGASSGSAAYDINVGVVDSDGVQFRIGLKDAGRLEL